MKKYFVISVVGLSFVLFSCGGAGENKNQEVMPKPDTTKGVSASLHDALKKDQASLVYICPCGGCPEVRESKPGNCRKCGIELVEEKKK
ncbi:MAG TPA: heavy metal-binding domain-containing protein [Bacteroidia bacterium]